MTNSRTTVQVIIRQATSRVPFTEGARTGVLLSVHGTVLGQSRGHASWLDAARAALKLADRRGYTVENRAAFELRINALLAPRSEVAS